MVVLLMKKDNYHGDTLSVVFKIFSERVAIALCTLRTLTDYEELQVLFDAPIFDIFLVKARHVVNKRFSK